MAKMDLYDDRTARNFTLRLTKQERDTLTQFSKKLRMKPSFFIKEALKSYYESIKADEEIKRVESVPLDELPLLINDIETKNGRARLQQRFIEAK